MNQIYVQVRKSSKIALIVNSFIPTQQMSCSYGVGLIPPKSYDGTPATMKILAS